MLAVVGCSRVGSKPLPLVVAAASDVAPVLEQLGPVFTADSGVELSFVFGSTGLFARQIEQGAPFDVFVAADAPFADRLIRSGHCDGTSRTPYAMGRLALVGPLVRDQSVLADVVGPGVRRVGITNPDHAPYGRAAMEALVSSSLWEAVSPRLVYGENVRQTFQMATSQSVDMALVARSLVEPGQPFVAVDPTLHAPLSQVAVACTSGGASAASRAFLRFLAGPTAQKALLDAGFALSAAVAGKPLEPVPAFP